jgi:hypothetical protein
VWIWSTIAGRYPVAVLPVTPSSPTSKPCLADHPPEAVEARVDARGLRGPAVRASLAVGGTQLTSLEVELSRGFDSTTTRQPA